MLATYAIPIAFVYYKYSIATATVDCWIHPAYEYLHGGHHTFSISTPSPSSSIR